LTWDSSSIITTEQRDTNQRGLNKFAAYSDIKQELTAHWTEWNWT